MYILKLDEVIIMTNFFYTCRKQTILEISETTVGKIQCFMLKIAIKSKQKKRKNYFTDHGNSQPTLRPLKKKKHHYTEA